MPFHHCTEGFYQEDTVSEQSRCTPGLGKCKTAHQFHYLEKKKGKYTILCSETVTAIFIKILKSFLNAFKEQVRISASRKTCKQFGFCAVLKLFPEGKSFVMKQHTCWLN